MRCLGEFTGHILKGARTPVSQRQEVSRSTEESTKDGVTLRRTTIDEVELPADQDPRTTDHVSE
ncbi:MAG: hypothetical protein QF733_08880 [Phycisphaerales bacterium]|nr:hypothetical protein [Phycisphaerales bacterium]